MFSIKPVSLFYHYIPLVLIATITCGLVYVTAQQIVRQGANDPQIQIAEDDASDLATAGQSTPHLVQSINPIHSLQPFVILYDQNGNILSTNATDTNLLQMPKSIFSNIESRGEDRFTWEPQDGLRFAAVIVRVPSKSTKEYVLVARSLREVEMRENDLLVYACLAWIAMLTTTLIALLLKPLFLEKYL